MKIHYVEDIATFEIYIDKLSHMYFIRYSDYETDSIETTCLGPYTSYIEALLSFGKLVESLIEKDTEVHIPIEIEGDDINMMESLSS